MTSSTIIGERKWASARRGGMTVLGKVAVPKPINLPSQRLENHGLDPNVEIVPKGTLSWGSRSSPGSNAWGMSALSPSVDGSSSSPSQLVGRPSSGGGTRPSTAGSEIAHDSNVNAWSSNSRPSSASGSSASNNVSLTSLRPRSADTRPGSSQLSRFAEPSPEISGAWGSNATSERIGLGNSGKDGFSLSSGDFPTLGSEKDESRKNTEILDHASYRDPGVSSGVTTITESMENAHRDDISRNADSRGSSWRKDGLSYVEDGPRPSMERCFGEPLPYQNPNMAPHYESWRGPPPVNPAGPVWYRGPPGPPPYGAPGGFPMEPFPCYPPQVPAPGLANSQAVPPRGAGPRGHYSTNGDMYRPHMSESYMRPGMPVRPGFYPAPVPYEGYYGPPMAFCNPSDRDLSFVGMPTGPPVYNRPINPNVPDPKHLHSRPGEVGAPEQVEPRHPNDPRENSKVLRKQNDHWRNQKDEQRWAYRGTNAPNHEKGILSKPIIQNNAWEDDYKKDKDVHFDNNALVERSPPRSIENKFGSANSANVMFPGGVSNLEDTDLHSVMENVTSPVDHSLIQKIEGLNAKARAPGGRQDSLCSDEQHDRMQIVNAKANQSATDANSEIVLDRHYPSGVLVPVSHDIHFGTVDRSQEITAPVVTSASRKPACGAQSRGNHGKGSFIGQEADGWRERSESHTVVSPAGSGSNIKNQVVEHHAVVHPAEASEPNIQKGDEESVMPIFDPSDAQRAKMKEIAKQRAIQLQKEEEERIRDQMAKALAKLEELNRRSAKQVAENPGHTVDGVPPHNVAPLKQEDPRNQIEPRFNANRSTKSTSASAINFVSTNERVVGDTVGSTASSMPAGAETEKTTFRDSILSQNQLPTADLNVDNAADQKATRQKRVGNKQRQNIHREKNSTLETIPAAKTDMTKDPKDSAGCEEVAGGEVAQGAGRELAESPYMPVSAVHQKKKSNGGKSNNKVEELPTGVSLTRAVAKESNNTEAIPGTEEHNTSSLNITSSSIQLSAAKDVTHTSENHTSLSHEDAYSRQNNPWKSQHYRKPRNSQGNRSEKYHNNDTVVWAPVRLHNKVEATDQTSQKAAVPSAPSVTGDDLVVNNSPKTKRAEMERYVPKPVAKELAQGSIQQSPSPSVDQAATNGTEGRVKASRGSDYLAKAGSTVESKHVDGKHRPRAQGTWCQRGSAESIPVQASQDSSSSAVVIGKNIETPNGCGTVKSDETLIGGPPSRSDHEFSLKGPEINACDGWNSANDSGFSSSAFAGGEDNVLSGKGKRHSFKGHKGTDNNQYFDRKGLKKAGLTNLQHPPIGTSQTERTVPLKENKTVGEHAMSHWQPKAQGSVTHNQQGNRSHSRQSFVTDETSKTMKRETSDGSDSHNLSQCDQGAAGDWIVSEGKDLGGGISSSRHQENKMDTSVASVRGHAYSSNQGSVGEVATGPFNAAEQHDEQRPSSGYRKNANHGGHFGKGLESRGDWNSTGQENKQHYLSGNRERHRPNAHFEYQPVDPYNRSSDRPNDYGQQTENQPGGPKFRGRGQSHARRDRGNFYGRQRGSPADAGNE